MGIEKVFTDKVHASFQEATKELEKTAELFRSLDWAPSHQALSNFFMKHHAGAFTSEQIQSYISSIQGLVISNENFEKLITSLVRKKVLRKYTKQGRKLIEVNY